MFRKSYRLILGLNGSRSGEVLCFDFVYYVVREFSFVESFDGFGNVIIVNSYLVFVMEFVDFCGGVGGNFGIFFVE